MTKSTMMKMLVQAIVISSLVIGPPLQAQNGAPGQTPQQKTSKLSCGDINVTDYPLNDLVQALFEVCKETHLLTEDIPTQKVTFATTERLQPTLTLLRKFGVIFQPVSYGPGDFDSTNGYKPGPEVKDTWVGCLMADSKKPPVTKGKLRIYQDSNNHYHLIANSAPAKDVIDWLHRLYGKVYRTFATEVDADLRGEKIDLSGKHKDIAISLDETVDALNNDLKNTLVKKIQEAIKATVEAKDKPSLEIWPLTFIPSSPQIDSSTQPPASGGEQKNDKESADSKGDKAAADSKDNKTDKAAADSKDDKSNKAATDNKSSKEAIDIIVDTLNKIYKKPSSEYNVVTRARQNLLIYGSKDVRLEIKRVLALVDVPWPQVQLNMWAIQASGEADVVAKQMMIIREDINATKEAMAEVQQELNSLIATHGKLSPTCPNASTTSSSSSSASRSVPITTQAPSLDQVLCQLHKINFDRGTQDALSLNEALIFWALLDDSAKTAVRDGLETFVKGKGREDLYKKLEQIYQDEAGKGKPKSPIADLLKKQKDKVPEITRLSNVYRKGKGPATLGAIGKFLNALIQYRDRLDDPQAPDNLRRESAVADRLLKGAMDAFAEDIQEIFLDPLLQRIQAFNQGHGRSGYSEGVTLAGRTRIVVTSGLAAGLESEMASSVETTFLKPFGEDLLDKAFPKARSTTSATETLVGAAQILAHSSPGSALLLAGALLSNVEPTFSKVAPGLSIKVRPTVLPDGGAANLVLDCRFSVETTPLGATRTDVWTRPPADAIKSHHFTTSAAVNVFDLFDISSFTIETAHPQSPFYFPILGRMPAVGPVFQCPRKDKHIHHESIILVNTVILPRALDLSRYYGDSSSDSATSPDHKK